MRQRWERETALEAATGSKWASGALYLGMASAASGAGHDPDAAARPPRQYWPPIMQRPIPDQPPLDPPSAQRRIRALLVRTRSLGQAARQLSTDDADGLADGLVGPLNTTIVQVLEIRAVILAGSGWASDAALTARNALMVREYSRGDALQEIGERHGVSHQRVRHLMLAFGACRVPEPPRSCSLCSRPVEAFGLCQFHYYRQRTYGDPEFVLRRGVNADHGTSSRYDARCRCAACRAANTARYHESTETRCRALAGAAVPHGSASTYRNWGCRCEPCHQAALARAALARAARRARRRTRVSP